MKFCHQSVVNDLEFLNASDASILFELFDGLIARLVPSFDILQVRVESVDGYEIVSQRCYLFDKPHMLGWVDGRR